MQCARYNSCCYAFIVEMMRDDEMIPNNPNIGELGSDNTLSRIKIRDPGQYAPDPRRPGSGWGFGRLTQVSDLVF